MAEGPDSQELGVVHFKAKIGCGSCVLRLGAMTRQGLGGLVSLAVSWTCVGVRAIYTGYRACIRSQFLQASTPGKTLWSLQTCAAYRLRVPGSAHLGLCIYYARDVLRTAGEIRHQPRTAVMFQLIHINSILMVLDTMLVSLQYAGFHDSADKSQAISL